MTDGNNVSSLDMLRKYLMV